MVESCFHQEPERLAFRAVCLFRLWCYSRGWVWSPEVRKLCPKLWPTRGWQFQGTREPSKRLPPQDQNQALPKSQKVPVPWYPMLIEKKMHNLRVVSWILFGVKLGLQEAASQIALRDCFREAVGGRSICKVLKVDFNAIKHSFYKSFSASHKEWTSTLNDLVLS